LAANGDGRAIVGFGTAVIGTAHRTQACIGRLDITPIVGGIIPMSAVVGTELTTGPARR
jgi:hypothetical protein